MQPWYFLHNGVTYGPVSFAQLLQYVTEGHLHPSKHYVWSPHMSGWTEAGKVDQLFPIARLNPTEQAYATQQQQSYAPAAPQQAQAYAAPQQQSYAPAAPQQAQAYAAPQQQSYAPAAPQQAQAYAAPQERPGVVAASQTTQAYSAPQQVQSLTSGMQNDIEKVSHQSSQSGVTVRALAGAISSHAAQMVSSSAQDSVPKGDIEPGSDPFRPVACLKKAWDLAKRNFMPLVIAWVICCVAYVILGIVTGIVTTILIRLTAGSAFVAAPVLLSTLVYTLVSLYLILGMIRMSLDLVDGKEITFMQVLSQPTKVLRVFCGYPLWSLLATILPIVAALLLPQSMAGMLGLGTTVWNVAFMVFGVFFLLKYGQYAIAIVDRNLSLRESIRYSGAITRNNKKSIFFLFILSLIVFPLAIVASAVAYRWMQKGNRVAS